MRPRLSLLPLALCALGLAACGGEHRGEGGAGDLTGSIRIDGSSTVFPLTEAVAEDFMIANPGVRVTVGVSGTGGGFAKFTRGEIDISNASRPIKDEEQAQADANGIAYIELPVSYDGLAIVTNPGNTFAACLTVEELRAMWEPGSEVGNWSQVRAGFPDRPLRLFGAGTDSGTYDYFTKAIVGEEGASRTDYNRSEDDNVLVQGVAGDEGALGFVPLSYYDSNQERLMLVGVDDGDPANGDGCIQPNAETVRNGTYQPLARPEFIYVNAAKADDPAVEAFVHFYLEHAAELATEVGYVPLSPEAYAAALHRFDERITGSVFSGGAQVGVRLEDLLRMEAGADSTAAPDSTAVEPHIMGTPGAPGGDSTAAPR
ncbi:MAG TPA: PstS family phosphate ABC transporter substrate-binding protein [Rhodothermales bacterium]|nr:PstS family phosphate ABC transporter substrate-binding protein [Rhodothermales bacterium]